MYKGWSQSLLSVQSEVIHCSSAWPCLLFTLQIPCKQLRTVRLKELSPTAASLQDTYTPRSACYSTKILTFVKCLLRMRFLRMRFYKTLHIYIMIYDICEWCALKINWNWSLGNMIICFLDGYHCSTSSQESQETAWSKDNEVHLQAPLKLSN